MNIDDMKRPKADEAVSRAYRDAADFENMEPPAALDDAIRAAARRAVKSGPAPVGKSWIRRWTPQLAVAAVVFTFPTTLLRDVAGAVNVPSWVAADQLAVLEVVTVLLASTVIGEALRSPLQPEVSNDPW